MVSNPNLDRFSTAVIIKIAYGHDIVSDDDYFLRLTGDIGYILHNSGPAGNTPIDWVPSRKLLPPEVASCYVLTETNSPAFSFVVPRHILRQFCKKMEARSQEII